MRFRDLKRESSPENRFTYFEVVLSLVWASWMEVDKGCWQERGTALSWGRLCSSLFSLQTFQQQVWSEGGAQPGFLDSQEDSQEDSQGSGALLFLEAFQVSSSSAGPCVRGDGHRGQGHSFPFSSLPWGRSPWVPPVSSPGLLTASQLADRSCSCPQVLSWVLKWL